MKCDLINTVTRKLDRINESGRTPSSLDSSGSYVLPMTSLDALPRSYTEETRRS